MQIGLLYGSPTPPAQTPLTVQNHSMWQTPRQSPARAVPAVLHCAYTIAMAAAFTYQTHRPLQTGGGACSIRPAPTSPIAAALALPAQAQPIAVASTSSRVSSGVLDTSCPSPVQARLAAHPGRSRAFRRRLQAPCRAVAMPPSSEQAAASTQTGSRSLICTSVTAATVDEFIKEAAYAATTGVDIIELRLDFIQDFDPERDLERIMSSCPLPYIVTYRPKWEGGNYEGPEPPRLATLKYAAIKGAPYVDVEYKAASLFFASRGEVPLTCKVILSSHNFQITPPASELQQLARDMHAAGADIVKIATMANNVADSAAVLSLLHQPPAPTIALAMGEKGVITRLLAAKYGGFLTFAALSPGKASAPGQPSIESLRTMYNFQGQRAGTKVFGIIGNPVSHSRSPLIHNAAFQHIGFDGVYVPLLVDDLKLFLDAFKSHSDFQGFSVTIPHKEAALAASAEVDPVAQQIGAVNTLVRQQDGSFKGYNTDWVAAIEAIEHKLGESQDGRSPLAGKTFLVIGAGGAGRALAFGAASRGARVLIANRNQARAEQLAAAMGQGAEVVAWEDLAAGKVQAHVLANTTSVGMAPKVDESPVPADCLHNFKLVFDAVYTPVMTRLLLDGQAAGCEVVDGLQMFVGQAVRQFELFTGQTAPQQLMQQTLVDALNLKQ